MTWNTLCIKKSLQFNGGQIFGKAANYSLRLAETMLGQLINCLYGGPKFLGSLTPVSKFNADALLTDLQSNIKATQNGNGCLKAIIFNGNRTN